jgi:anti-sigma factor RsiW
MGTALSTAMAASLVIGIIRTDNDQRVLGDVVAAHVRSLQGEHLTDVQTSDQHTVKPWFNGKLDLAPPVLDLTAQGFTLIGGRLDYIDEKTAASIVYRRRKHVINLFVTQASDAEYQPAKLNTVQGYNVLHWRAHGLEFFAISDINEEELREFGKKFAAGLDPART